MTNTKIKINNFGGKLPPQAIDMEKNILSCLFNDERLFDDVYKILKPECFYFEPHELIFNAICKLANDDKPYDFISVIHQLTIDGSIDIIGGPYYLQLLKTEFGTASSLEYHCHVVLDTYVKREMINMFTEKGEKLYENSTDIYDVYNDLYERLENLFSTFDENLIHHMNDSIERTIKELEDYSNNKVASYIKCGDPLFDNVIYTSPGMIIAIASPRSAGKTRYLIHLMKGFFKNNKDVAALWYSMEDSDTKIIRSFVSSDIGLKDSQMQNKGYTLSKDEVESIKLSLEKFKKWDIQIVNEQETISEIGRRFSKFIRNRKNKISFLIIDNIMLIEDVYSSSGSNQTSVEDKVAGTIRRIVNKANKAGNEVVVIFLHHMTKEMESKFNLDEAYRPKLAHMKGSTRFADIANSVVLLNKPGMYKDLVKKHATLADIKCINSDGSTIMAKRETLLQNMLICEVAKNRDGEVVDDTISVVRYIVDFGTMKFNQLKTIK